MKLKEMVKSRTAGRKYPTLTRIRVGRWLFAIANIPIGTSVLYAAAIPMMIPLSPSLWAKDKIRYFKEWMVLR